MRRSKSSRFKYRLRSRRSRWLQELDDLREWIVKFRASRSED
jgi:hypothetical protein